MISFKQYISLLTEDRIEFLKKKYKNLTNWEHIKRDVGIEKSDANIIINFWEKRDPSYNNKYLDWILRQYSKHDFRQEDSMRVQHTLENFERYKIHLTQRDINHYHHLSDLEDAIEAVNGTKSKREEIKIVKHDGADKIYDKGGVVVYRIKNEAAAKFYGAGTKWCTAAEHNNKFRSYDRRGPLYVVFCKDPEGKPAKYQFHFESGQFMDEKDRSIDLAELVKKNPELQDVPIWQGKKVLLTHNFNKYFNDLLKYDLDPTLNDSRTTDELIDKALDSPRVKIRRAAASFALNHKLSLQSTIKALNDKDEGVRQYATFNNDWY